MTSPNASLWHWLHRHAGFPARRLEPPAELLILAAFAVQADDSPGPTTKNLIQRSDSAEMASRRQQAENRRKHARFKANNRTKI